MSLKFSRVTLTNGEKTVNFLVSGAPKDQSGLRGWTAYRDYMRGVPADERVAARVETFLYGGEEPYDATPEEVAYMYKRVALRPDFIEKRTEKIGEYGFTL